MSNDTYPRLYIVMSGVDYEGEKIEKVYAHKDLALKELKRLAGPDARWDDPVQRFALNKELRPTLRHKESDVGSRWVDYYYVQKVRVENALPA